MSEKCCEINNIQTISLKHRPRPIDFKIDEWDKIHKFLWYAPSISSIQAVDNYLIIDPLYSNGIFDEITDVLMIDNIEVIEDDALEKYDKNSDQVNTCINCQGIFIQKNISETKVQSLLRHIRNAIAHGRFNIVNNLIVFIDTFRGKLTALIKIYYKNITEIIKILDKYSVVDRSTSKGYIEEKLIGKIFQKNGFFIEKEFRLDSSTIIDFIATKNGLNYAVEVKFGDYRSVGASNEILMRLRNTMDKYKNLGYIPIVVYDRAWLTSKARQEILNEEFIVLDKNDLANFFEGKLSELNL